MRVFCTFFIFLTLNAFGQKGYPNDTLWYDEDGRLKDEFVVQGIWFKLGRGDLVTYDDTSKYFSVEDVDIIYARLDSLVDLIKDDSCVWEIQVHTDCRGSKTMSRRPSHSRAESIFNYFVSQGVSSDKLVPKGYGENVPRRVSEAGKTVVLSCEYITSFREKDLEKYERLHQLNRRVVFKRLSNFYVPKN